ncbi:MAG: hypothetical protein KY468_04715 [Armatimonadetes bacterium]|nr:hypothetical protein [Armatimonadota bacterium]
MNRSLKWGLLAGAAYAYCSLRPARVKVSSSMPGDPDELLRLVAQVEREPELIPFVIHVQVEGREDEEVQYRVDVGVAGIPGWARFRKRIRPEEGYAEWTTLDGVLEFDQRGRIVCDPVPGRPDRFITTVTAETRFRLPLLGSVLAHASRPFLTYTFSAWLQNLEAALDGTEPEWANPPQ